MPLAMVVVANGKLWRSMTLRNSCGSATRLAVAPRIAIGRLAAAINSAARASAASGAAASFSGFAGAASSSLVAASATSSGRSRCTGPFGSLSESAIARVTVSATHPGSSLSVALVIGLNSGWGAIHIWMRRPRWSGVRLQGMAITGERSRKAPPTPVARLIAPGPNVAMQSPGAPVMRPVTSAAKPAEPSCAVSTNSTPPWRIASISGSTLPLGMPKPRVTPFALSVAMIRSALFMLNRACRLSRAAGTKQSTANSACAAIATSASPPSRHRCSGRVPVRSLAKVVLDHAEIGDGARDQIGYGDAFVLGMPLFDGARPPHRGLAALEAEEAGVERAMAVKGRRRPQPHAPTPAVDGAHERPIGSDLGGIHERAELGLDLPRIADIRRRRDGGKGSLRIVAWSQAPVEHQPNFVLHGVRRLWPRAHGRRGQRRLPEAGMLVRPNIDGHDAIEHATRAINRVHADPGGAAVGGLAAHGDDGVDAALVG